MHILPGAAHIRKYLILFSTYAPSTCDICDSLNFRMHTTYTYTYGTQMYLILKILF